MDHPCPLCGAGGSARQFEKNGFTILACPACETAHIDPMPSQEELEKIYTLDYFEGNSDKFGYTDYVAESEFHSRSFPGRAKRIEKWVPKGRVLDVGCADGGFLASLGNHWEKRGVELSKELLEKNPSIATALNPYIGYDEAAKVAKEAAREGVSVRDVVVRRKLLPQEEVDAALDVRAMTEPGLPD